MYYSLFILRCLCTISEMISVLVVATKSIWSRNIDDFMNLNNLSKILCDVPHELSLNSLFLRIIS